MFEKYSGLPSVQSERWGNNEETSQRNTTIKESYISEENGLFRILGVVILLIVPFFI